MKDDGVHKRLGGAPAFNIASGGRGRYQSSKHFLVNLFFGFRARLPDAFVPSRVICEGQANVPSKTERTFHRRLFGVIVVGVGQFLKHCLGEGGARGSQRPIKSVAIFFPSSDERCWVILIFFHALAHWGQDWIHVCTHALHTPLSTLLMLDSLWQVNVR